MKNKMNLYIKFLTVVCIFLYTSNIAQAAIPVSVPFSGPITMIYECSCNGAWLVVVYDYNLMTPVPMTFQFGYSMPRAWYNIFTPSVQTVGSYSPGGICAPASDSCIPFPTMGTITPPPFTGIGTASI